MDQNKRNEMMKNRLAQKRDVKDQFLNKINRMPAHLRPSNVGDINKILWPAFFSTNMVELAPLTTVQASFVVNAEAALVITALAKAAYLKTGAGPYAYTYIDTKDESGSGNINGLTFQIRDAQSGRVFSPRPVDVEVIGDGQEPTMLETPFMVLPNSTIEVIWSNTDATNTYVASLTTYGSRVRVQDQLSHLGTTTGPQGLAKGL